MAIALLLSSAAVAFWLTMQRLRAIATYVRDIQVTQGVIWALNGLIRAEPKVLPPLAAGGIRPPAALALAQTIILHRPRVVLELGPGASTFLILQTADSIPHELKLVSVEHDASFFDRAQRMFGYLGLRSEVVYAPLKKWEGYGYSVSWYDIQRLPKLSQIELLVVDGPPAGDGEARRFPALPVLRDDLAPGAFIFVDDTDRVADRECVEEWCRIEDSMEVVQDGGSFILLRLRP